MSLNCAIILISIAFMSQSPALFCLPQSGFGSPFSGLNGMRSSGIIPNLNSNSDYGGLNSENNYQSQVPTPSNGFRSNEQKNSGKDNESYEKSSVGDIVLGPRQLKGSNEVRDADLQGFPNQREGSTSKPHHEGSKHHPRNQMINTLPVNYDVHAMSEEGFGDDRPLLRRQLNSNDGKHSNSNTNKLPNNTTSPGNNSTGPGNNSTLPNNNSTGSGNFSTQPIGLIRRQSSLNNGQTQNGSNSRNTGGPSGGPGSNSNGQRNNSTVPGSSPTGARNGSTGVENNSTAPANNSSGSGNFSTQPIGLIRRQSSLNNGQTQNGSNNRNTGGPSGGLGSNSNGQRNNSTAPESSPTGQRNNSTVPGSSPTGARNGSTGVENNSTAPANNSSGSGNFSTQSIGLIRRQSTLNDGGSTGSGNVLTGPRNNPSGQLNSSTGPLRNDGSTTGNGTNGNSLNLGNIPKTNVFDGTPTTRSKRAKIIA